MSHNKPQSAEAQRKPSRMNTHKKTRLTFKQVKICHLERTCDIWKKKDENYRILSETTQHCIEMTLIKC